MAALTFFWHDYETFGRTPRRDWPAQFAGLRTNEALEPIGAPVNLFCKPPLDRLPEIGSVLLTGITPQQAWAQGLGESAFAAAVLAQLGQPGTVGVGYNTLRFDDEVTRHLLWRNLHDPYAREWQDGCGRWDLLDVVRCCYALRPEVLQWPIKDDGRPSFRLEDLSRANGLAHEDAHDALADVQASIGLARLIRQRQPRLWDFALRLRNKAGVQQELLLGRPVLHVSGMYPTERGCLAIVWPIATHPERSNEVLVWDLAEDPAELLTLSAETIRQRLFTPKAEMPEGLARLPLKTVHLNKSPIVISALGTLKPAQAERWGLDAARAEAFVAANPKLIPQMAGVWPEVFARPKPPVPDVDEDLYGGFIGRGDRAALDRIRRERAGWAPDQALGSVSELPATVFEDERLEELVFRHRARNHPQMLDAEGQARWLAHCRARLLQGAHGATTLAAYAEELDALRIAADEADDARGAELLDALADWADALGAPLEA